MALNQEFIGRTYPPSAPYLVGREKIREFAAAIGETSRACYDLDAAVSLGYRDIVAPPTFAIVLSMRGMAVAMFDPDLGLDYSRVVHGEQRFTHARPIVAGDEITVIGTIDDIRAAAGNDILNTRADLVTIDGEHVCTAYAVIVARGTAGE